MAANEAMPYPPEVVERIRELNREKDVLMARAAKRPYAERNHVMRRVIAIEDELARYYTPNL